MESVRKSSGRVRYFDIAKGIGILLVIIGHSSILVNHRYIWTLISTIHMPLFFFIGGYFFKKSGSLKSEIKKNIKRYVSYYAILYLAVILYLIFIKSGISLQHWLVSIIYGNGNSFFLFNQIEMQGTGGGWFFLAFFWARTFMHVITETSIKYQIVCIISLAFIGVKTYPLLVLPWNIQAACLGLLFMYIGYLCKKYDLFKYLTTYRAVLAILILAPLFLYYTAINGCIAMITATVPNVYCILLSFIGILLVLICCYLMDKVGEILNRILIWFGENTAIILCVHIFELHLLSFSFAYNTIFEWTGFNNSIAEFICRIIFILVVTMLILKIKKINWRKWNGIYRA